MVIMCGLSPVDDHVGHASLYRAHSGDRSEWRSGAPARWPSGAICHRGTLRVDHPPSGGGGEGPRHVAGRRVGPEGNGRTDLRGASAGVRPPPPRRSSQKSEVTAVQVAGRTTARHGIDVAMASRSEGHNARYSA
jgi:hypothetical protein